MTLSIVILSKMTLILTTLSDTHHSNTQRTDTCLNDTQHCITQRTDTWHNNTCRIIIDADFVSFKHQKIVADIFICPLDLNFLGTKLSY
jgi:hypothetical protein